MKLVAAASALLSLAGPAASAFYDRPAASRLQHEGVSPLPPELVVPKPDDYVDEGLVGLEDLEGFPRDEFDDDDHDADSGGNALTSRDLQERNAHELYNELPCNAALSVVPPKPSVADLVAAGCDPLSSSMGVTGPNGEVQIPCGSCVYVDQGDGAVVELPGGIDIHGMLVFPHNAKVTVRTPSIFVQGVLKMSDDREVRPENEGVQIEMTGTVDAIPFTPHVQQYSNDTTVTGLGPKPIFVAGGRLDIDTYPANCPTWLNIQDVVYDDSGILPGTYEAPVALPDGCVDPADRVVTATDFENGLHMWKGNLGGIHEHASDVELDPTTGNVLSSNSYLRVSNRTRTYMGPTFDIPQSTRECMLSHTDYIFAARFRLHRPDGAMSNCASSGANCLKFETWSRDANNNVHFRTKNQLQPTVQDGTSARGDYAATFTDLVTDGEWFVWTGRFRLEGHEAGGPDSQVSEQLRFSGPEEGVVVEMDDVRIELPGQEYYPTDADAASGAVCDDLFPADAGADGYFDPPKYPYPLISNSGQWSSLLVLSEPDPNSPTGINNFYRLAHRWEEWGSLAFDLTGGCLRLGAHYRVRFRARVRHPGAFLSTKVEIRVAPNFEGHWTDWGDAPEEPAGGSTSPGPDDWIWYEKVIVVSESMANAAADGFVQFRLNTAWHDGYWGQDSYADVDYDDISIVKMHGPIVGLVVDDANVDGCWGPGNEVLVTSHHTDWHRDQRVFLADPPVDTTSVPGKAVLNLETALPKAPTTAAEDPNQATEVALLGRNVGFRGEDDGTNKGGYLLVTETFGVTQKLRGVEFFNMGHYKVGDRYPITFRKLSDVPNGEISANLIRESNFRCLVVNGLSGLLIKDNVAYDNKGICMASLAGKEEVRWESNLVARNRDQWTDGWITSSFFIRDPRADFVGNVAAGGERRGIYYNVEWRVSSSYHPTPPSGNWNPRDKALGDISGNVAHSYQDYGFVLSCYHPRYMTDRQTFGSFRSYKSQVNAYAHGRGFGFSNWYLADAWSRNMDLEWCDDCDLSDFTIVGYSPRYREQISNERLWHTCRNEPHYVDRIKGIETFYFQNWNAWPSGSPYDTPPGATLTNVNFESFDDTGCARVNPLYFQRERRIPHFDNYLEVTNMSYDDDDARISLCTAEDLEVQDVIVTDLDSSLHPDGPGAYAGYSSIVSDHTWMTALAGGACRSVPEKCYAYCENTCLRTVTYTVSPYDTEDVMLQVTNDDTGDSVSVPGNWQCSKKTDANGDSVPDVYHNTKWTDFRYFSAALPEGNYTAKFVDAQGNDFWPTFVLEPHWERQPPCGGVEEGHVTLIEPAPTLEYCEELVKNGDIDTLENYTHFYHVHEGGVVPHNDTGVDGSYGLVNARWGKDHGIGFYVDQRCVRMLVGHEYHITAKVKLVDGDTGDAVSCDPDNYNEHTGCPNMWLQMRKWNDVTRKWDYENWSWMAKAVRPYVADQYNLIEGTFTIPQRMADSDSVMFWITRGGAKHLYADDISIKRLDRDDPLGLTSAATQDVSAQSAPSATDLSAPLPGTCPQNFIVNSDMELTDTTEHWRTRSYAGKLALTTPGVGGTGQAMKLTDTTPNTHPYQGIIQWIRPFCFVEDGDYEASARFRMTDPTTGDVIVCNPLQGNSMATDHCPKMTLYARRPNDNGIGDRDDYIRLAETVAPGDAANEWGTIHSIFKPHPYMLTAFRMYAYIEYVKPGIDVTIDDFTLTPYTKDCTNVVKNGDFESGTPAGWEEVDTSQAASVVDDTHGKALKLSGRYSRDSRIYQNLDKDCIEGGVDYMLEAKVKMYDQGGNVFTCDPNVVGTDAECPIADLMTQSPETRYHLIGAVHGDLGDGWYYIRGMFEFYPYDVEGTLLRLRFYRAPKDMDLILDDVKITKVDYSSMS